jgi:hypothetical protein
MPDMSLAQVAFWVFLTIFGTGLYLMPELKIFGGVLVVFGLLGILFTIRKALTIALCGTFRNYQALDTRRRFLWRLLAGIVIGGILGTGLGIGSLFVSRPATTASSNESFLDVSPTYILKVMRGHTYYQGHKLLEQYIGKRMKVEGPVTNVGALSDHVFVILDGDNSIQPPFSIALGFNKEWLDRASSLALGDRIVATGHLSKIDTTSIELSDCEFHFSVNGN